MTNNEIIKFLQSKQIPQCGDKVYTADEEYEAYQRAIDAVDQTTWIPVSERLPETEERILILFDDSFVMIGHYIDWQDGTPITWVLDGQEDYNVDTNNIIAWMPLPSYQGE